MAEKQVGKEMAAGGLRDMYTTVTKKELEGNKEGRGNKTQRRRDEETQRRRDEEKRGEALTRPV